MSPSKRALLAGAKALRKEARKFAFEAGLYTTLGQRRYKPIATEHTRLLRYAQELELAGRNNGKAKTKIVQSPAVGTGRA